MVGPFNGTKSVGAVGVVRLIKVQKGLDRWFKEKWVDVSRKDKDGKHPPCGRKEAKTSSKGYPKCRPSVRVSSKTPKTAGEMTSGQKRAATKRKRSKRQGVKGKPTMVKGDPMGLAFRLLKMDPEESAYYSERGEKMDELAAKYAQRMIDEGTPDKGKSFPHQAADPSSVPRGGVPRAFGHLPRDAPEVEEYGEWMMSHPFVIEENRKWANESNMGSYRPGDRGRYRMIPRSEIFEIRHPGIMGSQEMPTLQEPYVPYVEWARKVQAGEIRAGEPMDLAWRLLKDRKSPEAFRHKKEYDTEYESSPERVKYREELNRERRRRGMYGDHSGRDISHTEGGKLTVESEHANRARHFKDRGTLRPTTSQ